MKSQKIYKVRTNGYDMFVTTELNENGIEIVRYYSTEEFVYDTDIRDVEDDSSWEIPEEEIAFSDFISTPDGCDKNEIIDWAFCQL